MTSHGSLLNDIRTIMALVLEIDAEQIDERTSRDNTERWDSLANLNLVIAVEEKYGIQLLPEEMERMASVKSVVEVIEKKLGS